MTEPNWVAISCLCLCLLCVCVCVCVCQCICCICLCVFHCHYRMKGCQPAGCHLLFLSLSLCVCRCVCHCRVKSCQPVGCHLLSFTGIMQPLLQLGIKKGNIFYFKLLHLIDIWFTSHTPFCKFISKPSDVFLSLYLSLYLGTQAWRALGPSIHNAKIYSN